MADRTSSRFASEAKNPAEFEHSAKHKVTLRRRERSQASRAVTPVMANRSIKRAEKELMSRHQNNQRATHFKANCRAGQLYPVLGDMLEHVEVEDGVERPELLELVEGASDDATGSWELVVRDPSGKS